MPETFHITYGGRDYTRGHLRGGREVLVAHQPWYDPEVVLTRRNEEGSAAWRRRSLHYVANRGGKMWRSVHQMLNKSCAYLWLFSDLDWNGEGAA